MEKIEFYGRMNSILGFIKTCCWCLLISIIFVNCIAKQCKVIGSSMYPYIKEGESVIVDLVSLHFTDIKRFDVVVAKNKKDDHLWVKRVIGLPNDTIQFKNEQLYINGTLVQEPFLNDRYIASVLGANDSMSFTKDTKEIKLQNDEYFLVGDNRIRSLDSRDPNIGPFSKEDIVGKGWLVIYPFENIRFLSN